MNSYPRKSLILVLLLSLGVGLIVAGCDMGGSADTTPTPIVSTPNAELPSPVGTAPGGTPEEGETPGPTGVATSLATLTGTMETPLPGITATITVAPAP